MKEEKIERLATAVHLYTETKTPVSDILRETHISSSELYHELKTGGFELRGAAYWMRGVVLNREDTIEVMRQMARGKTMHAISKELKLNRSSVHRAVTEHVLDAIMKGEDVREWLK